MSGSSGLSPSANANLIVDAWPVMEWLKGREPAKTAFRRILEQADANDLQLHMSSINLGEVLYSFATEYGLPRAEEVLANFQSMPVRIVEADNDLVMAAARLKAQFKISYADAVGTALSIRADAPFLTGDKDFIQLETAGILRLHWIGK